MADQSLSEKLAARLVALRLEEVPDDVVQAAKLHLLDCLGVLLAGSRLEPGRRAYDLALSLSAGTRAAEATLAGSRKRVPLLEAAAAMATAAHCGEMDDIHSGAGTCVGAMIVPALLAMGEKYACRGRAFLEAVIAGYETVVRVGLAIRAPRLFTRGWWPSTLCGAFGVAAAGAKLLGWTEPQTVNALGIASLHAGGMLTGGGEGPTARHLLFGRCAQSGLLAVFASRQGFTGPRRAFEEPRGFCLTLCEEPEWGYLEDGGRYFLPEVAFKPYPCARQLHAGVEALLWLMREHAVAAEEIERIDLSVPTTVTGLINRPDASPTHAAALASGQYVMAVTAIRREMNLSSFDAEQLESGAVRRLMTRVSVSGEPELDRYFPKSWPGRVRLKLSGNRSFTREVQVPKGERENPMSEIEVQEKFRTLAAPVVGGKRARSIIAAVRSLELSASLKSLRSALRAGSP